MALKIITGYTGEKHITPADDAGFHKSIFGSDDYVLHAGSQFAATVQSATEIKIADGELLMQGRHARNESGYESVTIANGSQGMYRNDLIVARYAKNASTSVESISLVVITGTATTGTATDPAHNTGNIDNGETRDFPLYRVKLNGITIESVEKLWETPVLPVEKGGTGKNTVAGIKSLLGLAKAAFVDLVTVALGGTGKTSHTSNAVLTGNGTNAVNNVATANGAFYATGTNGAAKFGTLPIAQGGTGSTTQAGARTNLGLDGKLFTQYALNGINIDSTSGNWTVDISDEGHGTVPMTWVNVTQTSGAHFIVQTAIKCDTSQSTTNRNQKMWIRDRYSQSGVWSEWKEVLTEKTGIQMVKLWENSSTVMSFSAQNISVSAGYDFYAILYAVGTITVNATEQMGYVRGSNGRRGTLEYGDNYRSFMVGNGYIEFYSGHDRKADDTDNSVIIPIAIYGIKGVQ